VREGYASPRETYGTNVMGTVNVLDALRVAGRGCTALIVTTDKCYRIEDRPKRYAEADRLGGRDPYSSSKACAELVVEAYRRSYFPIETYASHRVALASARAGNVIGGGDWAAERLLPDIMRPLAAGDEVLIRSPDAVRPWQHVLEPLSGYLWLAARMATEGAPGLAEDWNFGPRPDDHIAVSGLVEAVLRHWGGGTWRSIREANAPHEAAYLGLDCSKAHDRLDWWPVYDLARAVEETVAWYRQWRAGNAMREFTIGQIRRYMNDAAAADAAWARDDGTAGG
jgi:CDP-glucose 4,6-dehydratase